MKKITGFIVVAAFAFCAAGCEKHEKWGDGRPDLEHVYIFLINQPDNQVDYLSYEVAQNGDARWRHGANATSGTWRDSEQWVAAVPFNFRSERVRAYDVVSYFWIESTLAAGTDYTVTLDDGTAITPDATGGYPLSWPQARRADRGIKIKRTPGSPDGTIRVQTFNPTRGVPVISDVSSLVNNKTSDYEVRCTTLDVNKILITFN